MLLKEYIRCCIKEVSGYNSLNTMIKDLNAVVEEHRSENGNYAMDDELIYFAESVGLDEIGAGEYRKVYALPQENWVLKIAYSYKDDNDYKYALRYNAKEVEIGEGEHGLGSRDLFVKVLGSDKLSEMPTWLITERAIDFDSTESFFSLEDMEKIFPTFWGALKENSPYKRNVKNFCSFISDTLDSLGEASMPGYSIDRVSRQDIYNSMKSGNTYDEASIVDLDKIKFSEDVFRILRACAYSMPTDMHTGNIGIIKSGSPSPSDIVILDYILE